MDWSYALRLAGFLVSMLFFLHDFWCPPPPQILHIANVLWDFLDVVVLISGHVVVMVDCTSIFTAANQPENL